MKRLLFSWLYFDDRWNVFAKICTVSIRRVCAKEFFVFMIVELKEFIPFVVQTILEVTFNGQWLAEKISDNNDKLIEIGLCVQRIVTDNTSNEVYLQAIS